MLLFCRKFRNKLLALSDVAFLEKVKLMVIVILINNIFE